jgi:propane monooxygenase coupling protein
VTTFKTAESPYKSDNTASNRCGFTLMNNQVGAVVARVMKDKPNVTVTFLPSMIRVDAVGRMDVDYDEVSDALGEEPGYFDAAEFEENMSTHYGRMIHLDDRTIMFANPEEAAEYLGFDLTDLTDLTSRG